MEAIHQMTVPIYSRSGKGRIYSINVEFTNIKPGRPTVVMLHGYLGNTEDYGPVFYKIKDANLLAIDLRGHGESDAPLDLSWNIKDLVYDITQILDLFIPEGEKVSIVASSLSTAIAIDLARCYPERIADLFLLSPTTKFIVPYWVKLVLNLGKITPEWLIQWLIDLISSIFPMLKPENEREFWKEGAERFRKTPPKVHQKIIREALESWTAAPKEVLQPVFAIAGMQDNVIPVKYTFELIEQMPNATLLTLDFAEHFLIMTQRKIVFDLLCQWIHDKETMMSQKYFTEKDLVDKNGNFRLEMVDPIESLPETAASYS